MMIKFLQRKPGVTETLRFAKFRVFFIWIAALVILPFDGITQDLFSGYERLFPEPAKYVVSRTLDEIIIDGKAEESSWKLAGWSEDFVDIEGDIKPKPRLKTHIKMLWDTIYLYILAEMEEPNVWAYYDHRDQIIFHENDFEVFLDPDGDTHNYFEFEVNALNTIFDLFLTRPYWDGGVPLISWNAPGFKSAVNIVGTLNNPSDNDEKWTVEMAIPFDCLFLFLKDKAPLDGQVWKVNFSRVQWKTEAINGKYEKLKDEKTGLPLREDNWVWSPTGEINLHVPERWGMILFSEKPISQELPVFKAIVEENIKKYVWLVYYKQEIFKHGNGRYALSLNELSMPETVTSEAGESMKIRMEATNVQFSAFLTTENNRIFSIDHQGLVIELKIKEKP